MLVSYIPVTADALPAAQSSPTGYPLLTEAGEVMITCLTVDSLCESQGDPCLDISVTAFMPPGVFYFVVHASSPVSNVSEVAYTSAAVTVADVPLIPGSELNELVICSLLWEPEPADPLSTLSELSSLTSTLIGDDGFAALLLPAYEITGDGCLNTTGPYPNASSVDQTATVADAVLQAMARSLVNLTDAAAPCLINAVEPLSSTLLSVLQALLSGNGSSDLSSNATVLSTFQGDQLLAAASVLVSTLSALVYDFQAENSGLFFVYNAAVTSLANVYGTLISADSEQHCHLMQASQDGISRLLTVAMANQSAADTELLFSGPLFSASSARLSVSSDQTTDVGGLQMQLPAASLSTLSATTVDVQLLVLSSSLSWWSCFPTTVRNSLPQLSPDVTGSSLLDTALFSLSLWSPAGSEYTVLDLPAAISWQLPYTADAVSSGTPTCAFFNASLQAWSTDGCTSSLQSGSVGCSCSHLTPFSLIAAPDSTAAAAGVSKAAGSGAQQPASYAVWLLYLIPLTTASFLLLRMLGCCGGISSSLPHAAQLYVAIIVASFMRCLDSVVLCFDWTQQLLQTVDKDTVAVVSATLLFLPLVVETGLLFLLLYRNAMLGQREDSKGSIHDERLSRSQRWTSALLHRPVLRVSGLLLVCIAALVVYLFLMERTDLSLLTLLACVALSSLVMFAAWLLQLDRTELVDGEPWSRQGQALGCTAQLFHVAQAAVLLSFTLLYASGDSWYVNSPLDGVYTPLTVYSVVEVVELESSALLIRWLVASWQRSTQIGVSPLSALEQRRLSMLHRPPIAAVAGRRRKKSVFPSSLSNGAALSHGSISLAAADDGAKTSLLAATARSGRVSRTEAGEEAATRVRRLELNFSRDEGSAAPTARSSVNEAGYTVRGSQLHVAVMDDGLRSSPLHMPVVRSVTASAFPPLVKVLLADRSGAGERKSSGAATARVSRSDDEDFPVLPAWSEAAAGRPLPSHDTASVLATSRRSQVSRSSTDAAATPRLERPLSISAPISFATPPSPATSAPSVSAMTAAQIAEEHKDVLPAGQVMRLKIGTRLSQLVIDERSPREGSSDTALFSPLSTIVLPSPGGHADEADYDNPVPEPDEPAREDADENTLGMPRAAGKALPTAAMALVQREQRASIMRIPPHYSQPTEASAAKRNHLLSRRPTVSRAPDVDEEKEQKGEEPDSSDAAGRRVAWMRSMVLREPGFFSLVPSSSTGEEERRQSASDGADGSPEIDRASEARRDQRARARVTRVSVSELRRGSHDR